MKQISWFDIKFTFDHNQNLFPSILERLSGTPIRLEEKLSEVALETLTVSLDHSWSIKEHIGHLIDLEPLWQLRLEDIISGISEVGYVDLSNEKTDLADHNNTPVEQLLSEFRKILRETLVMLHTIHEEPVFKAALHPRLKTPLSPMDLFLFVAEHDAPHLARITTLIT